MSRRYIISVSGKSTGGTSYTQRIIRGLNEHRAITMFIKRGEMQSSVARHVRRELELLEEFCGRLLPVDIVLEE